MSENTSTPLPHLREWRLRAFLSQKQLATLAGVHHATILNQENIDRKNYKGATMITIHKLAHALDLTPKQLVEGPEDETP